MDFSTGVVQGLKPIIAEAVAPLHYKKYTSEFQSLLKS